MPTNLDFNVIAKTDQARGQIDLLTAQIRTLGRELRAAVKAGDTAGAERISQTMGTMRGQVVALNRTLPETTEKMTALGRSTGLTQRSFRSLEGAISSIGKSVAGARAGLVGFAAVMGAEGLGKIIGNVVSDLNKLQQTASNTTLSPEQIRAFQDSMLKAGVSVDDSRAALLQFGKAATDARMKAGALGDNFGVVLRRGAEGAESGIIRMTGATSQFVRVLRGDASNAITDISDPFKVLGINVASFGNNLEKLRTETAKALQDFKKFNAEAAAAIGQGLFGADWDKITQQIAGTLSPTPINEYAKAWGDLEIAIRKALEPAVITLFPALTAALEVATGLVKNLVGSFKILAEVATATYRVISSAPLPPSSLDQAPGAPPFAAGGYIRGPGTGTSDSILARLSNGEFVMRAAAVDRWGPRFMSALNNLQNPFGYHSGGLVRTPRFAAGGMVTATTSDGLTVNLNFPGGSFALRGDAAIVGGLTREARRAGMLSAGRMAGALA